MNVKQKFKNDEIKIKSHCKRQCYRVELIKFLVKSSRNYFEIEVFNYRRQKKQE